MRNLALLALVLVPLQTPAVPIAIDVSGVRAGPIAVAQADGQVTVAWPDETGRAWRAAFSLDPSKALVAAIGPDGGDAVVRNARPFYQGETGIRRGGWYAFFDDPASHPDGTRHVQGTFRLRAATARTVADRVEIVFDGFRMGSFEGSIAYTFYPGSRLIRQAAIATTYEPDV